MECAYESEDPYTSSQGHSQLCIPEIRYTATFPDVHLNFVIRI